MSCGNTAQQDRYGQACYKRITTTLETNMGIRKTMQGVNRYYRWPQKVRFINRYLHKRTYYQNVANNQYQNDHTNWPHHVFRTLRRVIANEKT